ncbi:DUF4279 domain-containing protein [Sphingopyxis sp. SE2]|jgi:hypothetical protein|uniref:DUF4279 domain-containing protein n=1 Tax=unclassified Sphingopyxis TaxID=2614943 RepID=UPI0009DEC01D|nr:MULTISPECIES: DUF4279 domain-containing protein [unclassified Sphingopyxis]MDT7528354.1 DUF4279 domain-containing protein [Sphingopyxis sp. SE2]
MAILHKSAASLGFYGDDLDPTEITDLLGGEPSVGVRKGGTWLTSLGAEKVARTGSWRLKAHPHEPANLDFQISWLLNGLTKDLGPWRSLSKRYRGRIFCGLFLASGNEGLTLQPETLVCVGERGLLIDLDIYGQDVPD